MTIAAGIFLIRRDNTILVGHPTKHASNFWSIPKGKVESGETPLDAAIRETFEETNVNINGFRTIHSMPNPISYKKQKKVLHPYVLFESENDFIFDDFELKCNSNVPKEKGGFPEMDAFRWIKFDEANDLLHETQVRCLDFIKKIMKK